MARGQGLDQPRRRRGGQGVPSRREAEAPALDVLQLDVRPPLEVADGVDLHDVRVLEPGDDLRLGQEPFDRVRPGILAGQDHLQGDHAVQPELARLVDDAHAPAAELPEDLVPGHFRPLEPREPKSAEPAPQRARRLWIRVRTDHRDARTAMGATPRRGFRAGQLPVVEGPVVHRPIEALRVLRPIGLPTPRPACVLLGGEGFETAMILRTWITEHRRTQARADSQAARESMIVRAGQPLGAFRYASPRGVRALALGRSVQPGMVVHHHESSRRLQGIGDAKRMGSSRKSAHATLAHAGTSGPLGCSQYRSGRAGREACCRQRERALFRRTSAIPTTRRCDFHPHEAAAT